MCKRCRKSRGHSKKVRHHDGHFTVYYLPEHHYIGMTNALKNRLQEHRSKNGRITDGYEIVATFDRAVDAHLMETKLHAMGYDGFHYNG
jgi:predicted GIY-YIG superfamily endonuclease